MNKLVVTSILVSSICGIARADGLLYRLPADGASAQFEMTIANDKENPRTVSVVMRSGRGGPPGFRESRQ
jgi:hypothetical protein